MQFKHIISKSSSICFLVLIAFCSMHSNADAERFFQKNSTWYEKIPDNPAITPYSDRYISLLKERAFGGRIYPNYGPYSVSIFQAKKDTPITTVKLLNPSTSAGRIWQEANHWNDVPIPDGAAGPGQVNRCARTFGNGASASDSHMIILNYNRTIAWEFFGAMQCDGATSGSGTWYANTVRKQDLIGNGVCVKEGIDCMYPYDLHGSTRLASVALAHGIVTYDEVMSGTIDHAMTFVYHASRKNPNGSSRRGVYPSYKSNVGILEDPDAMLEGMRIQLDPKFDCNSISGNAVEKMVCVALQEYGMIFVDDTDISSVNSIMFENLDAHPSKSWSGEIPLGGFPDIPIDRLRVINPIYPTSSSSNRFPNPPFLY